MPQTAAGNLGTQLGELLFGRGGARDDKAYYQGQATGSLVSDRMASARKSRAAAMIDEDRLGARQGITPEAVTTAGYAPNQAALLGDILRSNTNVDLRDLGTLQSPGAGQALADAGTAMRGGDTGLGNALLALASGKPLETTKVAQGQAFNPYGTPDQQVNLTAIGDALVREKGASAADKSASAGAHHATARLRNVQADAGGYNPRTGAGKGGKPGKITSPDSPDAVAYLGNTTNAAAFTAWRSQHPGLRDGNEAWIAFRSAQPIGAPTGEPAKDDGSAPVYEAPASTIDLSALGQLLGASTQPGAPAAPAQPSAAAQPRRAPDGNLYVPDPNRPGKWLRVDG